MLSNHEKKLHLLHKFLQLVFQLKLDQKHLGYFLSLYFGPIYIIKNMDNEESDAIFEVNDVQPEEMSVDDEGQ